MIARLAMNRGLLGKLVHYGWAAIGPVGVAGSQFVLSLQVLHLFSAKAFGSFAFLLVMSQFSAGVWSALFCAPLPIMLAEGNEAQRRAMAKSLLATDLSLAFVASLVFFLAARLLEVPVAAAAMFAVYGGSALLRWFARAYAYSTGTPLRTTASDIAYSVALLIAMAAIALSGTGGQASPYAALMVSAIVGLLPFGRAYLQRQFGLFSLEDLHRYLDVWRRHSSWSLIGVVTTEATANAHAYLVTSLLGPAAFAPVAASALIIRPIAVVMNALTDFERPQMARQIGAAQPSAVLRSVLMFRLVLIATWVGTAILAVLLMVYASHVIFPDRYPRSYIAAGAALWMAVAGVRLIRTPESVLLQAAGAFRWLAYASVISSGVSVLAVLVLLGVGGPLWSVAGVLLGEIVFAFWIWRQARRWHVAAASHDASMPGLAAGAVVSA